MHIAITGSTGLVGREFTAMATPLGSRITRMVRGLPVEGQLQWDPLSGVSDVKGLEGVDAVVHLAGENISAKRWTDEFKRRIRDSRVLGTRSLCESIASLRRPPRVLVAASAVGFYGDRPGEHLDESSPPGTGFLAETCREWEDASAPARDAGIRVVLLRFGMVLSAHGGALAKMLLPFRLGLGGRVGSGRQIWSWITVQDAAGAIAHCLATESLRGPVNAVTPEAVSSAEFARAVALRLRRPAFAAVPAWAARAAFGEMADELLLSSACVRPRALLESGFAFRYPTLNGALQHLLG
jgi:uncharacterized protein (TIGR01777 family)